MSTKTIAVASQVYERLAQAKREGESFSRAIDRMLQEVGAAHTGHDVLRGLDGIVPLPEADAAVMMGIVEENRDGEAWERHDLR